MFRSGSEHNRTVTQVLGLLDRMGAFVAGRWQRRRARHRGAARTCPPLRRVAVVRNPAS
jgi:hypothetical protein